ncbi:MAG: SDR family NAD(P)-dependent oxidoreductase, partial [Candidatus Lokiarchaeota archaeon]|nr:SDR family NAD(P)-dependent oxidoreductase [Candidatus Lokiarchaeota archaeon]
MLKEKLIKKQPFDGKIVIVSGGSTGMGKATAKNIVQLGGSVCIIARNVENLKKAVKEIESLKTNDKQFVEMISCDTTKIEQLKPLLAEFIEKHRVPDYLFNFVGYALPDYIENYKLEDFQKQIDG